MLRLRMQVWRCYQHIRFRHLQLRYHIGPFPDLAPRSFRKHNTLTIAALRKHQVKCRRVIAEKRKKKKKKSDCLHIHFLRSLTTCRLNCDKFQTFSTQVLILQTNRDMHLQHGDLLRIFRRWKSYESEFGDDEEHHRFLLIREVTMTLLQEVSLRKNL